MIIHILITVAVWFILMLISVNLLGLLVRGLFSNPEIEKLAKEGQEFIREEAKKSIRADKWINIFALILIIAYLYSLFHFWNIGVMAVAIVLIFSRLPDLLWEIRHGKKMNRFDAKSLPKNPLYYLSSYSFLVELPLLYYSIYLLK